MTVEPVLIRPLHNKARWEAARHLSKVANHLARGDYKIEAHAIVVILVSNDDAEVTWKGIRWKDELDRAIRALEDARDPEWAKQREAWRLEREELAVAHDAAHPFRCTLGSCDRRFASQKGLDAHLRLSRERGQGYWWQHQSEPERPAAPVFRPHAIPVDEAQP